MEKNKKNFGLTQGRGADSSNEPDTSFGGEELTCFALTMGPVKYVKMSPVPPSQLSLLARRGGPGL